MQMQEQRWCSYTLWGAGDWSALQVFFVKNKTKQIKVKITPNANQILVGTEMMFYFQKINCLIMITYFLWAVF